MCHQARLRATPPLGIIYLPRVPSAGSFGASLFAANSDEPPLSTFPSVCRCWRPRRWSDACLHEVYRLRVMHKRLSLCCSPTGFLPRFDRHDASERKCCGLPSGIGGASIAGRLIPIGTAVGCQSDAVRLNARQGADVAGHRKSPAGAETTRPNHSPLAAGSGYPITVGEGRTPSASDERERRCRRSAHGG